MNGGEIFVPIPSEEQQKIIDFLLEGKNVIVNAVAGAGKSTSVLSVARTFSSKKILQFTYNSSLRLEMCEKVEKAGITNLDVHTYHSFAVKYFNNQAYTDIELRHILRCEKECIIRSIPNYEIIVIDEAQDMTMLYYRFVKKVIHDILLNDTIQKQITIIILGDDKQNLYSFKGADSRFLTMGDLLWKNDNFVHTTLKTSYRITRPMAEFVNQCMLGENRMISNREGSPVMYIHFNRRNLENKIIFEIKNLIDKGAKPSDFFILAGSVKGKMSNIRQIENSLVERGIPCNVPMFDNESMDDRVIQGKVVFSTFHCVKGRQRPYVFVVGFSQSYMDYMCRGEPNDVCPNTLYVACTRASERLYLLEEDNGLEDRQLQFLKHDHTEMNNDCEFVDFKGIPKARILDDIYENAEEMDNGAAGGGATKKIHTNPTELVRFISEDVFDIITPIIEKIFVSIRKKMDNPLQIPVIHQMSGGNYEEISDINGISIPCMYYDHVLKKKKNGTSVVDSSTIYNIVKNEIDYIKSNRKKKSKVYSILENKIKDIPKKCSHTKDYLFLSNMYIALKENLYFKLNQISIDDYNWLSPTIVRQSFKIIREALVDDFSTIENNEETSMFTAEETIITYDDDYTKMDNILMEENIRLFRLNARVDLITPKTIWEIKCTGNLNIEHMLQVVIYAWIWRVALDKPSREFKLLNIKTGEVLHLCATNEELSKITFELFKNKYNRHRIRTDEEFLEEALGNTV